MSFLLDTCILSKMRRLNKHPDKKLETWFSKYDSSSFYLSVLTVGEIEQGINKLKDQKQKILLENWLFEEVLPSFNERILPISLDISAQWGKMSGELLKEGLIIPVIDGLLAATASIHNLTLVTENMKDFRKSNIRLYSPWI